VPRMVVAAAAMRGIQPLDLYAHAGVEADALMPGGLVSFELEERLVQSAADLADDPDFGLAVGQLFDPDAFNILAYIFFHSPTLREGLSRAPRYQRLFTNAGGSELHEEQGDACIRLWNNVLRPILPRQNAEWALSAFWKMVRTYAGDSLKLRNVRFRHARPDSTATHVQVFGVEPRFSCTHNELVLDPADLDRTSVVESSAPATYQALLEQADSQLRELQPPVEERSDFVREVLLTAADELRGGHPKVERIARRLALSTRSLQRQLTEQGTSFRAVVDELRRSFSSSYLRDSDLSIEEVAYLLGFSSREGFHRAFQRWHAMAPQAFREQQARG
ncbi:MAG: AraC family transcriptional regulator, partial [Myxococcota bacterium]